MWVRSDDWVCLYWWRSESFGIWCNHYLFPDNVFLWALLFPYFLNASDQWGAVPRLRFELWQPSAVHSNGLHSPSITQPSGPLIAEGVSALTTTRIFPSPTGFLFIDPHRAVPGMGSGKILICLYTTQRAQERNISLGRMSRRSLGHPMSLC